MSASLGKTVTIDGVTLTLVLTHKRVKNVNARLHGTTLHVSAPLRAADDLVDKAVVELARRLLRRSRAREVNAEEDAVALARRVAARFPGRLRVEHVEFVTTQSARWGSYSGQTGTIRLNAALREMPRWVLEAVVAHELAHAVHLNH